jgi:hypothetical protein
MLYLLTYALLLLRHRYPVLTSCPHSIQHSLYFHACRLSL